MDDEEFFLSVNGEGLGWDVVEREMNQLSKRLDLSDLPEGQSEEEALKTAAIENVIENTLLYQEADKLDPIKDTVARKELNRIKREMGGPQAFTDRTGIDPGGTAEKGYLEYLKLRLRYNQYLDQICADVPQPDREEQEAFYDKHPEIVTKPRAVHVQQIQIRLDPESGFGINEGMLEALNLRQKLIKGQDFIETAEEYSDCPDEIIVGWVEEGEMIEMYDQAIFSLEIGEISDIIQTRYGLYLVTVTDRREEQRMEFEEMQSQIVEILFHQAKEAAIGLHVDVLKEKADIVRQNSRANDGEEKESGSEDGKAENQHKTVEPVQEEGN